MLDPTITGQWLLDEEELFFLAPAAFALAAAVFWFLRLVREEKCLKPGLLCLAELLLEEEIEEVLEAFLELRSSSVFISASKSTGERLLAALLALELLEEELLELAEELEGSESGLITVELGASKAALLELELLDEGLLGLEGLGEAREHCV